MAFEDQINRAFSEASVIRPVPRNVPQAMETVQDMIDIFFAGAIEDGEEDEFFLFLLDDLLRLYSMIIAVYPNLVSRQYPDGDAEASAFENIE